jgi:exopolysaccharide production protein ExoQ
MDLLVIGVVAGPLVAVPLFVFIIRRPHDALGMGVMLVLMAGIKFRDRDTMATLTGVIDAQVAYELGFYALLLLISLRGMLLLRPQAFQLPPLGAALAAYVGLALLSALWSPNLLLTAVRAGQLAVLFTYAAVAIPVLGPERVLRVFGASLIWYVLICAALASLFPFADGTRVLLGGWVRRFSWFKVHPIAAGSAAACAALFALAWTLFSRRTKYWWTLGLPLWLYFLPLVGIMMATHSRGPLFAFLFAALLLVIRKYLVGTRAALTSDRLLLGLLGIGLALATTAITGRGQHRLRYILLRGQTTEEFVHLTGRTSLWDVAFDFILARPVFGQGFSAARDALLRVVQWGGHTHNGLLESLFSLGIVGTALLWIPALVLLGSSFLRLVKTEPSAAASLAFVAAGMVFLLLSSVSDLGFAGTASYETLMLFLLAFAHSALVRKADHTAAAVPFVPSRRRRAHVPLGA